MPFLPKKIQYETTCETREQYELYQYFLLEMKALKEIPIVPEWDGQCRCGHKHSEHHPISSHNYSAGHCTVGECRCKHFI